MFARLSRHFTLSVVVFLGLLNFVRADEPAQPDWIWEAETAKQEAPEGESFFRIQFDLAEPVAGRIDITADNSYRLYVNGTLVGEGNQWEKLDGYYVRDRLVRGKNVIAVAAKNVDGPAGLVAKIAVQSRGANPFSVSTSANWKASRTAGEGWQKAGFDESKWKPVHVFGPLGKTGPWGEIKLVSAPAAPEFVAVERPAGAFQLLDDDRVLFLGDTLIERAQVTDYFETFLTVRFPKRQFIFRNLGWSGDNVFGESRAGFGTAEDGFRLLRDHVYDYRPTVIFVAYGANASFDGPAGIERFRNGLAALLDMLEVTKARVVLLSPVPHERQPAPLPNPDAHNKNRGLYSSAIGEVAKARGHLFVDLFHRLSEVADSERPLTNNGIHLNPAGYWWAARSLCKDLQLDEAEPVVVITKSDVVKSQGVEVKSLSRDAAGVAFRVDPAHRPEPPHPNKPRPWLKLTVSDLPAGTYELIVDGQKLASGNAADWAKGLQVEQGKQGIQTETLRRAILAKNQLYFYRWRPQNETYLLGFRKHEQGNNAIEIPQFDPLIAKKEAEIHALSQPTEQLYELKPVAK